MRILHVAEVIKGGVATFLNTFGEVCGLEHGVDNKFLVPHEQKEYLNSSFNRSTFSRPKRGLRAIRNLTKCIEKEVERFDPDVIWFHSTFSLLPMAILRVKGSKDRFIYTAHGWGQLTVSGVKKVLISHLERTLCKSPDIIVNISKNDQIIAERSRYGSRNVVVENALPDTDFNSIQKVEHLTVNEGELNLLFVGRFDYQKGLDILLDAFEEVCVKSEKVHLHIIGGGQEQVGRKPQNSNKITYYNWLSPDEINAFYRTVDLLVMPSRWEGLPMVLIESLRAGTPVLVSNASDLPSLIEIQKSGLVAPLSKEGFAQVINNITKQDLLEMREASRSLYEDRYSTFRFQSDILNLLNEVGSEHLSNFRS